MKKTRLIIFVKAPVAGKVKTRLGKSIGMLNAARLYRSICFDFLKKISAFSEADVELWATPDTRHPFFLACRRELGLKTRRQPLGDLGQRMYRSIKTALRSGSEVILTGSDMPDLSVDDLELAISLLKTGVDVVFSPSSDGGYGLVGMSRPVKTVFYNMRWSHGNVLSMSLKRLQKQNLRAGLLPVHNDIDTLSDYRNYYKR